MEGDVAMSCWPVWKRCALALGPKGLAGLELQKMGESRQHSVVLRLKENRSQDSGQQFALTGRNG